MKNKLSKDWTGICACLSTLLFIVNHVSAQAAPNGISLLNGYKYKQRETLGVLSATGIIYRENGLLIEFEEGMNTCCAADPANLAKYAWFREQTINGRRVYVALLKEGVKTGWEPEKPRNKEFGNILVVSFPLGGQETHGINFIGEILSDAELADALLMILTFDPKRR